MKILVIEDEPRILEFLRLGLEAEGFTVDGAEDGASRARGCARRAVRARRPRPAAAPPRRSARCSGSSAASGPSCPCSSCRRAPTCRRSSAASTSAPTTTCRSRSRSTSSSPASASISATAGTRADGASLRVGHLSLDLARRRAEAEDCSTDLSDREFRLLYHLVAHAGEVVSRERLLSEVWGYSFDPGSNVVDVCVRRLRKKLGPAWPIETVRHAGYRLATA